MCVSLLDHSLKYVSSETTGSTVRRTVNPDIPSHRSEAFPLIRLSTRATITPNMVKTVVGPPHQPFSFPGLHFPAPLVAGCSHVTEFWPQNIGRSDTWVFQAWHKRHPSTLLHLQRTPKTKGRAEPREGRSLVLWMDAREAAPTETPSLVYNMWEKNTFKLLNTLKPLENKGLIC